MTRVLRVYHAGRDEAHRARERALVDAGVDVTLVVPTHWPEAGAQRSLTDEPFEIVELPVHRAGDVNRHRYRDPQALASLVARVRPDVVDIHEEPFSLAARQWLRAAGGTRVTIYTAQNLDKRYPPPFAQFEKHCLAKVSAMYPCSRQAASVVRGKGFTGRVDVLPLGYSPSVCRPGAQSWSGPVFRLGLVGRLVPEKGVRDAVRVLAGLRSQREVVLDVVGEGPELGPALQLAQQLGVRDQVQVSPWLGADDTARHYREMHVLLVPSCATPTWVEQFGRVIPEAQASGAVVVGYASGAIAEVAGSSAVLFSEKDVAGLAAAVGLLERDPAEWELRRKAGIERAAGFTWSSVASRQAALYRDVVEGRGAARRPAPAHPGAARLAARSEFGAPAGTGIRPMALPVVRTMPRLEQRAGRIVDLTVSTRARLRRTASRPGE